ncbi:hypothetical protein B2J86_15615 [Acidovorax sp. SRB_14]|uniref:hypothetical protein n=1 Tax=unclassified Acidovorax TaxID=2684926 RepID=UPI00145E5657|nr:MULTISPECIES: hypothetical protein [unclassified Acidovorax]NMM77468.1 hypothetical protein [Acidovorax sp. SRB_24]NMM82339.1 hypothetical protein [Acidovorax sp. SRB_14]NMM90341.1 hypothetical protein [Rhodococcus sp. SRB_17]
MKRRHHLQRPGIAPSRALVAFVGTVVLALVASAALLWPDSATNAADALARARQGLEHWIPASLLPH